jgi:hypothetical protein
METEIPDVEAIVSEANEPEAPREGTPEGVIADAMAEAQSETDASNAREQAAHARTLKWKGKEIGLDDDAYQNYAQKGYDYDKKMHDFRVERKLFAKEREQFEERFKELEQINEFAKSNPQFEQLIQQEWARVQSGEQRNLEPQDQMQILQHQVTQLQAQLAKQTESAESRRAAEMEATQEGAIGQFKEEHPFLDWETKDEQGFTLEDRVGNAMLDQGVRDFGVMAKAMLMDKIIAHKTMAGKEQAAKKIQEGHRLGLGKVTKESQAKVKPAEDIRNKSYGDLAAEAIAEFSINN